MPIATLAGSPLRDTGTILARAAELLDFTKPAAITLLAILHAIPDSDDPHAIVATLLDAVPSWLPPPGAHIACSGIHDPCPRGARRGLPIFVRTCIRETGGNYAR